MIFALCEIMSKCWLDYTHGWGCLEIFDGWIFAVNGKNIAPGLISDTVGFLYDCI